ncbi:MAG: aminoglycoside 6-adenylyltransferase [Eubacterium sp.]|jgi:aminoglycoside 6-adenylyltransferase|nr:aminoglycoside 6-adenylyltransferase [Eubacterium sp.]
MRTPDQMLKLILGIAEKDETIRAVLMTGSRANEDCPADVYQDFDIVYFVRDVKPYWDNMTWIKEQFGMPSLMQKPESMKLIPPDHDGSYIYLMIFPDGNRIDLQITADPYVDDGEPAIVLLDKDGDFPKIEKKKDFWYVKRPDHKIFSDCCSEFHWCLNNVAKGIARDELSYAMEQLNHYVRDMLILMLTWYVGVHHDFSVSVGKNGKYFKKFLPKRYYQSFLKTYPDADDGHMWEAAFEMLSLFGETAREVAGELCFGYDDEQEKGIEQYMEQVRNGLEKQKEESE